MTVGTPLTLVRSTRPAPPKRVVLLDDDLTLLRAVERLLVRAGFSVTATHDPREALEVVLCQGADAVVADLYMPDVGGNVVLAMIAQASPSTARVLMTSDTDFDNIAALTVPCSVSAYVPKREVSARLVSTLRELTGTLADSPATPDEKRAFARSLLRAVAGRDHRIESHSERAALWAKRLAVAVGLSNREVLDVELGALLHDVGQVGVPGILLRKLGPLTAEETERLRRHPDVGAALLTDLAALRGAIPVVRHHHERPDGQGYPHGLAGNAIPLAARIFQIADAYDAIVSSRPHRNGLSDAEARCEIARHVGSQFDPDIHEIFSRIDPDEWRLAIRDVR